MAEQSDDALVENIKNSVRRFVTDLTNVKVVTVIEQSPVEYVFDDSGTRVIERLKEEKPVDAFVTEIDLVDGDLVHVVPPSYADHPEIADLHSKNVGRASNVVPANLKAMADAAQALIQALQR